MEPEVQAIVKQIVVDYRWLKEQVTDENLALAILAVAYQAKSE